MNNLASISVEFHMIGWVDREMVVVDLLDFRGAAGNIGVELYS